MTFVIGGIEGVKLPATQVPSADLNTWDDYEEGTVGSWTPVVRGSGTAGTYELDASTQASYTKNGNEVTLYARIVLAGSLTAGGTGNVRITGVPFTMPAATYGAFAACSVNGIAFTGSQIVIERVSAGATTTLYMYGLANTGTQTEVPISAVGASDVITFTLRYQV
jgi:hypothetical protein